MLSIAAGERRSREQPMDVSWNSCTKCTCSAGSRSVPKAYGSPHSNPWTVKAYQYQSQAAQEVGIVGVWEPAAQLAQRWQAGDCCKYSAL